jgi:hypothetical protein
MRPGGSGRLNSTCGGGRGGEFGLELADNSLQFHKLLIVFFGEFVELFAKLGLLEIQRNEKCRGGEQRQPIE